MSCRDMNSGGIAIPGGRHSIAKLTCCRDACTTFTVSLNARSGGEAYSFDAGTRAVTLPIDACARPTVIGPVDTRVIFARPFDTIEFCTLPYDTFAMCARPFDTRAIDITSGNLAHNSDFPF